MCTILGHGHQCGKATGGNKWWAHSIWLRGGGVGHPQSQAWATSGAPNHPQPLHASPNGPVGAGGALGLAPRGPHHPTMGSVGPPGRGHNKYCPFTSLNLNTLVLNHCDKNVPQLNVDQCHAVGEALALVCTLCMCMALD